VLVLLDGLQAGNRSGTGRYTTELARRLPHVAGDLDLRILWPDTQPCPDIGPASEGVFMRCAAGTPARRLYTEHIGIRALQRELRADLVHFPASVAGLLAARGSIVTVHDVSFLRHAEWFRPGRAAYYRLAVRRSVGLASRVIADSEATARDLMELAGVSRDRIDVVPLGVDAAYRPADLAECDRVRARYALPARFFLYVGTIEPRKNLARLVDAWSRIAESCDADLVLAGREGWRMAALREAMARSPRRNRIHLPGFVRHEDLPGMLGAAQIFVWPSLYEGFGLPPLEAMACGVPVITSNTSSLPEVVADAAITVDPYDVEALAQAMAQLAQDRAMRDTLRQRGLQRAALFSWCRTAELTVDAYRKACPV